MQIKMRTVFFISVSYWTVVQITATVLFKSNNKVHIGNERNTKAGVSALPILHVVFDVSSEENAQTLSFATRNLLSKLQNADENFKPETMMSVSTFSGEDLKVGSYLKVLSEPINVINNSLTLIKILQFDVTRSVTNNVTRDPGAAIRDAVSFLSRFNPGAGGILYLVSRRYVDGGSTVKELDMIATLLRSKITLICVEGGNDSVSNGLLNLKRIAELRNAYYFTNTQFDSWASTNNASVNKLIDLSRSPINSVRRWVGQSEYFGVSNVAQTGSFWVTSDPGIKSFATIQSSQKGIVTMALTNNQTGENITLATKGGTNWNMINANLSVDALYLPSGESSTIWTYALTFEPDNDAFDTKSDVVILGNKNALDNFTDVWTSNCNLDFPDQQNTVIYAEMIGSIGVLTGLSVTVTFKNVDDTSSQDVSIILTEEVQGTGLYSGIFNPPSDGLYDFSANFTVETDSVCTRDLCTPSNFLASAPGRCRIQVQGKDIDATSYPTEPSEPSEPTPEPTETSVPCDQNDPYGVHWKTHKNETLEKNCSEGIPGALGSASWKCICINNKCTFETSQPDFTKCNSSELLDITKSINKNDTNVTGIWIEIEQLTASNRYYGQEIVKILINAVEALLDRMQREIDSEENPDLSKFLEVQKSSSDLATRSMDHLVSNEAQWKQLIDQGKGDNAFLAFLNVSNDIAFRLSNVSKQAEVQLICEYSFANVTISSSYWDGTQGNISNCNSNKNASFNLASLRFPNRNDDDGMGNITSYIQLPKDIGKRPFKSAGVFIAASNLLQLLLPGNNSKRMDSKEVNSPLISYTLYYSDANSFDREAPLPDGSHVQLVFKHEVDAKYPYTVRASHRDGDKMKNSTVIGSSVCSFIKRNQTNSDGSWTWDDEGCQLISNNSTYTVCNCTHLTGFANLMDFHDNIGWIKILDIASLVCSILSIACLALTFFIHTILRSSKTKRTILIQNLCATLIISQIVMMTRNTLEIHYTYFDSYHNVMCPIIGMVIQYFLLAAFMWMLIEGYQFYRMVSNVFDVWTTKTTTVFYVLLAYTVPLLVIMMTITTASFFKDNGLLIYKNEHISCWLDELWALAFAAPAAAITLANFYFLYFGVRAWWNLKSTDQDSGMQKIKQTFIRVASQTLFLGLTATWVMGIFIAGSNRNYDYAFWLVFTISNGLKGVFIFIDRCILNTKIRISLKKFFNRLRKYLWSKLQRLISKKEVNQSNVRVGLPIQNNFDIHTWSWVKSSLKLVPENRRSSHEVARDQEVNSEILLQELPRRRKSISGMVDFDEGESFTSGIGKFSVLSVTTCESYV